LLAPSAVVAALVEQHESGRFETYVPSWFADVAAGTLSDLDGYLAGAAEYYRSKTNGAVG